MKPDLPRRLPRRAVLASSMALVLGVIAAGTGCASGSPASGLPPAIHAAGNRLVDSQGRTVRLLGVSISGTEYSCVQNLGIFAGPTDKAALAALASWQINAVRLPLNEDCWLGINGVPLQYSGARYRTALHAFVTRLNLAGFYVILDLHWNAPGRDRAKGQQPMADLDHAPVFWSSVARTFRSDPAVAFDLYNEPRVISWHCWRDGCVLPGGWRTAGMQTLIDAVRSTGARQPVIATGIGAGNDISSWLRYRPHDPIGQLAAGFHVYNFLPCNTVACWNKLVIPVAQAVPLVVTEIGEVPCSHAFIDRFMRWADSTGISYLAWGWNPAGCGAPSLITSWDGQPTPYGEGFRAHLITLHSR